MPSVPNFKKFKENYLSYCVTKNLNDHKYIYFSKKIFTECIILLIKPRIKRIYIYSLFDLGNFYTITILLLKRNKKKNK